MIYREEKGLPLTADDLDGNFRELLGRIEALEEGILPAEGIGEIKLDGSDLVITGQFGHDYGRFKLPSTPLPFKGPWSSGGLYRKGDWVCHQGRLLRSNDDHQAHVFSDLNWSVVFEPEKKEETVPLLKVFPSDELPKGKLGEMILVVERELKTARPYYHNGKEWRGFEGGDKV